MRAETLYCKKCDVHQTHKLCHFCNTPTEPLPVSYLASFVTLMSKLALKIFYALSPTETYHQVRRKLKWHFAGKELIELARWRNECLMHRNALSEHKDIVLVLDNISLLSSDKSTLSLSKHEIDLPACPATIRRYFWKRKHTSREN